MKTNLDALVDALNALDKSDLGYVLQALDRLPQTTEASAELMGLIAKGWVDEGLDSEELQSICDEFNSQSLPVQLVVVGNEQETPVMLLRQALAQLEANGVSDEL